ncbi:MULTISPECIES: hypothetical protein [Actinomycetes]|jgi:hypothetical protein|uniref:hypothetical protein n=1 Tax=Actinomycetes TaxID=1760 RepID=UPI00068A0308|nr:MULTISPECIES: hypothetical protein [Actinomycetes]
MTDRESEQGWASDPQVAHWLGEHTDPSPDTITSADPPVKAEPGSTQSGWSPDTTVWAQNAAVNGWLASEPPAHIELADDPVHPDGAHAPVEAGYDTQITAPMSPITATGPQPTRSSPMTAPAAIRPTVTAAPDVAFQSPRRRPSRRTVAMGAAVLTAAVVVLGLIITAAAFVGDASDDSGTSIAQPPAPSAVIAPPATPEQDADCPNRSENGVITGRDPGGTSSGPAVIKAFEHAYFVQRSGVQARAFAAPLARVPTAEQIQTGIDSGLVPGTRHCLAITSRGDGLWGVELTMLPPAAGEPVKSRQLFQTAEVEGRTLITAITKDTDQ